MGKRRKTQCVEQVGSSVHVHNTIEQSTIANREAALSESVLNESALNKSALWREHYADLCRFRFSELLEIASRELFMFATNRNDFRALARQELRKQRRSSMVAEAATLLDGAEAMGFHQRGRPGIRAQLVERKTNQLGMDFVIEGDAKSTHVLNAVSPALTCAIRFAQSLSSKLQNT